MPPVIHALGCCFLRGLRRLCSAGLREATSAGNGQAAGSHSDGWRRPGGGGVSRRGAGAQGRPPCPPPVQGAPGLETAGWPGDCRLALSATLRVMVSLFLAVPPPPVFPAREHCLSLLRLLFLEDLLYCIQIHIRKRLPQAKSNLAAALGCESDGGNAAQPGSTNRCSSPDTCESGRKT